MVVDLLHFTLGEIIFVQIGLMDGFFRFVLLVWPCLVLFCLPVGSVHHFWLASRGRMPGSEMRWLSLRPVFLFVSFVGRLFVCVCHVGEDCLEGHVN
jgi:hypothetical protein